jgi:hypothetical protein
MTVTDRRQTRTLVREGASQRQHNNFQTENNIALENNKPQLSKRKSQGERKIGRGSQMGA